jgi:hypothetical protein
LLARLHIAVVVLSVPDKLFSAECRALGKELDSVVYRFIFFYDKHKKTGKKISRTAKSKRAIEFIYANKHERC